MNRIAFMVIKNLFRVPNWFFQVWKMGRCSDKHTEQQRYSYLRKIVTKLNKSGRVKIVAQGIENIPNEDGFIMFPNHQGLFDVLALIEACSHPFGVIVKKEASRIILVKQIMELLRGQSIDREDIRSSMKIISNMTEEVKNGRNYIIFAEGTRSRNENQILEFKGGTFKSAVNAKCPILPIALIDSYKPFDIKSIKNVVVQVCFLAPIYYEDYKGLKTVEIANLVRKMIQNKINEKI